MVEALVQGQWVALWRRGGGVKQEVLAHVLKPRELEKGCAWAAARYSHRRVPYPHGGRDAQGKAVKSVVSEGTLKEKEPKCLNEDL